MNHFRRVLLFIIFTTQSFVPSYADSLNLKSAYITVKDNKYNAHFFDAFQKDNDLYIKNLWILLKANFKVELSPEQIDKISIQMKTAIPKMRIYADKNLIKIGYQDKTNHEYTLSDFNHKDKSFHMNGVKLQFDMSKNFSENIQSMTDVLNKNSNNNLKHTLIFNPLIKDSHAFIGLVLKGLAIVLAALVVPTAIFSFDAQIMQFDFRKLNKSCDKDTKNKNFTSSDTDKFLENLLLFSRYKEFFEKIEKYKNCLLYVENEKIDSRFSEIQLDAICQIGKLAYRCIEEYKKLKSAQENINETQNIPSEPSTPSQGLSF